MRYARTTLQAIVGTPIVIVLGCVTAIIIDERCSQNVSAQYEALSPERTKQLREFGEQIAKDPGRFRQDDFPPGTVKDTRGRK